MNDSRAEWTVVRSLFSMGLLLRAPALALHMVIWSIVNVKLLISATLIWLRVVKADLNKKELMCMNNELFAHL